MLKIHCLPAFTDNYIWLIETPNKQAWVVDPGCGQTVEKYLEDKPLTLVGILITHHHHDHTGGIAHLQQCYQNNLKVYGPSKDNIVGLTHPLTLEDHQSLQFNHDATLPDLPLITVISVPGHTKGHIVYVINNHLFCGDTLFSGGCGRMFEGTPEQFNTSLQLLAELPDTTKVYCAHEYTLANLKFATTALPHNKDIEEYQHTCTELRHNNRATIPSTIGIEKRINPFLLCHLESTQNALSSHFNEIISDEVQSFTLMRQWKDSF
ncbi:hydroxyacylglutathione hydrolase [Shewanella gaetbuli]